MHARVAACIRCAADAVRIFTEIFATSGLSYLSQLGIRDVIYQERNGRMPQEAGMQLHDH